MFTAFNSNQMFPEARFCVGDCVWVRKRGRRPAGQWRLWHVGCTTGRSLGAAVEPGAGHQRAAGPSGKRAGRKGSLFLGRRWMVVGRYTPSRKLAEPETLNHPRHQAERPGG